MPPRAGRHGGRDPAEGNLQITLLEDAVLTKEDSRYIGGVLLKWKTMSVDAKLERWRHTNNVTDSSSLELSAKVNKHTTAMLLVKHL